MKTSTTVGVTTGIGTAALFYFMVLSPFVGGYAGLWAGHGECVAATNEWGRAPHDEAKHKRALALCEADRQRFIDIGRAAEAVRAGK